jgi:hypothetical protein
MILIDEGSPRRAVDQFCEHYHRERNHQELGNTIIEPDFRSNGEEEVQCRQRPSVDCCATTTGMPHEISTIRVSGHYGVQSDLVQSSRHLLVFETDFGEIDVGFLFVR